MYAYSREEYIDQVMDDIIENEMQNVRKNCFKNLSEVLPFETLKLTRIILYAWSESHADAIFLTEKLNLGKLEFLAVVEDFDEFKKEYLKDLENAQNF